MVFVVFFLGVLKNVFFLFSFLVGFLVLNNELLFLFFRVWFLVFVGFGEKSEFLKCKTFFLIGEKAKAVLVW